MAEEKTKKEDSGSVVKSEAQPDRPGNLCCYSQRVCSLEKLKGFDFCHKHILEDKASPFKPCDFVAKSNARRCPNPAPKLPDRGKSFCIIHTRKAELRRAVEERRKKKHPKEDDVYGYDAGKEKRRRTSSSNSQKSDRGEGNSSDEETAAGSCDDYPKVDSAWHGDIDSDADSVDSEEEDPLKHAGVWTVEEATRMCRDKMMRLRSLYIAQFKRLQHVLKERKRKYCLAIQAEEEEEAGECQLTPSQLLGRKRRHERPGSEALLHKQAKEKKQGTPTRQQTVSTLRCTYSPGGNRCTEKVMPLTKHCMKHITHDPKQQLFQRCSFVASNGDTQCERIVSKVFTHDVCKLHTELPTSMKRPDIKRDLQEARERAKLRSSRVLENKDEAGLPNALQQKSSALVPPSTSCVKDTEPAETLPSAPESAVLTSVMPTASPEKMEICSSGDSKAGDESALLAASTSASAPSSSSSLATLSSISPALENISPVLAAASLVAVCSSPQIALQGTLLDSVSNTKEIADVKSLTSREQKRLDEDASCEIIKEGVDSKPAKAKKADSLEDVKDAWVAEHYARTVSQAKDSKKSDGSSMGSDKIGFMEAQAKASEQVKAESSVLKGQEVLESSSKCSSRSSSQLLSEEVVTPETTSASGKDTSPPLESDPTESTAKVPLKSVSESALKNSRVDSPTSANTAREPSAETPATAASKGAASMSNASTIGAPAPTKASRSELSMDPPQVSSKGAAQVASKSESSSSQGTGKTSMAASFASAKTNPRENSDNTPKAAPKRVAQAAPKGHTDASLGTPSDSNTPQSASTKARESSENTPNTSSRGVSQVLPKGDTQKASSHGVVKQSVQVTSGGSLRAFQAPTTATTAPVTQPSKTKLLVTSDIPRPSGMKAFQHLPSGMTSSSSKQFSAITSVASKDTGKDLKADHT